MARMGIADFADRDRGFRGWETRISYRGFRGWETGISLIEILISWMVCMDFTDEVYGGHIY